MDTAVQALHYARLGYENVHDFFPWAQEKLQDPLLVKIWNILIHRHFECDIFEQYFLLLELRGDEERFYQEMYRKVFRSEELQFAEIETRKAIHSGNNEFGIAYSIIQMSLKGENITLDSLRDFFG